MEKTVLEKSKRFALRIVNLNKYLTIEKKEYVMSNQLFRCGTSIGANVTEAECAFSKKDFLAKMYIAFKECAETGYWLDLLYESNYITEKEYISIKTDCDELKRMLSSITKTTKELISKE